MKKINFITGNRAKVIAVTKALAERGAVVDVVCRDLNLMEPQFDTVQEVSAYKAKEAFELLKAPVLVEDSGFVVNALNGFPGVYTKYVLGSIGARGILKLMAGEKDRRAGFVGCASFIDADGELHQFMRSVKGDLELSIGHSFVEGESPYAWSELWNILYSERYGKMMCDLSEEEVTGLYETVRGSLQNFAEWYAKQYE